MDLSDKLNKLEDMLDRMEFYMDDLTYEGLLSGKYDKKELHNSEQSGILLKFDGSHK